MAANGYEPFGMGVGTLLVGRYEIERKLGAGATSAVFKVRDRTLNSETYALKVFDPEILKSANELARFRNEILITRRLNHPNIVRTFEFGKTATEQYFLTMEYICGRTLWQLIHASAAVSPSFGDVIYILYEIAQGISYAHSNGVIHRDLKLDNVLLSNDGEVKIADFGLACRPELQLNLTEPGKAVGTPAYMAPEQLLGKEVSSATDIYALGVLAYELVTGKLPFSADSWYELAKKIIDEPLPKIAQSRSHIPQWYVEMVRKATAKEPEQRYHIVEEISALLEQHLDDKSVSDVHLIGQRSAARRTKTLILTGIAIGSKRRRSNKMVSFLVLVLFIFVFSIGLPSAIVEVNFPRELNKKVQKVSSSLSAFWEKHKNIFANNKRM